MRVRVYIPDEDEYGEIVSQGAFTSLVRYTSGGIQYEIVLLNEDFVIVEEKEEL